MKKVLLILLISISSICIGQSRIALPTINKDTLFIVNDESGQAIVQLWEISTGGFTKPIFVKLTPREFEIKLQQYNREKQYSKTTM